MLGIESLHTIDVILNGLIVGIIVSAPMGPVGMLVVRRTLMKGRNYGFATGIGAAISDLFYSIITGIGMGYVMSFLHDETTFFLLKVVGSVLLVLFGWHAFRTKVKEAPAASNRKGNLLQNCATGFLLTVSNPLVVFLFMALMARFDFISHTSVHEEVMGYLAVFGGAVSWWFILTTGIKKAIQRFDISYVHMLNRILGVGVMIAGAIGLITTLIAKICS